MSINLDELNYADSDDGQRLADNGIEGIEQDQPSDTLVVLVSRAIAEKNYDEMVRLREICDRLHEGEENVEGFVPKDLPIDALYEQMVKLIASLEAKVNAKSIEAGIHNVNTSKIDDYFMGSVPKLSYIEDISDPILMPKYDGCSCGLTIRFNQETKKFVLFKARTRGRIVAKKASSTSTTSRNYQDVTNKLSNITEDLIKGLNNLRKRPDFKIGESEITTIKEIVIRGEVVLKDISKYPDEVPASFIAGKLNGLIGQWIKFTETGDVVFKPFEVVRVASYKVFTIPQLEACKLFNEIGIDCPFVLAKRIRPTVKSEEYVKSLYHTSFNGRVIEPIDGVV